MKTQLINNHHGIHKKKGATMFLYIALFIGLMSSLIACSPKDKSIAEEETLIGYITLNNDILELDEFEFITSEDKERIKELNVSDEYMPNGYYIYNESEEISKFDITNETEFTFFDLGNLFVKEEADKKYTTTDKEEFRQFLYGSEDIPRRTPFWIKVQDKSVISVTEQFVP